MPVSKTPGEYYRYYCASQHRVEQWVQETGLQLQQCQSSQSDSVQWKGFLEDPGLITPISISCALDKGESREIEKDISLAEHVPRNHDGSSQSRSRHLKSAQMKVEDPDDLATARSSSKHSKKSKLSMRTISTSKTKPSSASRKRHPRTEDNATQSMLVYLPYGVIPLLLAMTTGSSSVSLAAASIMLAGYFCLDHKVGPALSPISMITLL